MSNEPISHVLQDLLSHAHRTKDLLTGASALLSTAAPMVPTACNIVLEARAQLDGIVYALESLAAVEAEAKRMTRLNGEQQARVTASVVGGAR